MLVLYLHNNMEFIILFQLVIPLKLFCAVNYWEVIVTHTNIFLLITYNIYLINIQSLAYLCISIVHNLCIAFAPYLSKCLQCVYALLQSLWTYCSMLVFSIFIICSAFIYWFPWVSLCHKPSCSTGSSSPTALLDMRTISVIATIQALTNSFFANNGGTFKEILNSHILYSLIFKMFFTICYSCGSHNS